EGGFTGDKALGGVATKYQCCVPTVISGGKALSVSSTSDLLISISTAFTFSSKYFLRFDIGMGTRSSSFASISCANAFA
ncbi:hypothetical protein, partial [Pontibacter harenae]|uniref:hypothetical protein n=1 Tax=Pontibacter harenae TaxID=2894083 RepID=UPI001E2F09C6